MTILRSAILVLGSLLALPAAAPEPLAGLWEGKLSAMQPPAALTIDFDSRLVSVNGTTALPLTIALAGDPVAVHFSFRAVMRGAL
jgi:hypothetical protein